MFPWGVDANLSTSVQKLVGGSMSTLTTYDSFQGIGTSFTVYFGNSFGVSNFLTSYKAMCIMDYFITFCARDTSSSVSDVMYRCVEYFTKKRPENFQALSITSLSQLSVSTSGNIVNTGCNLLISSIVGK